MIVIGRGATILWSATGVLLVVIGLWPWLDPAGYQEWQRIAAPWLGPADPGQPPWHRCDAWLHFGMVVALSGWFAIGLRRFHVGSPVAGPLAALACAGADEAIQALGGRGRTLDRTDLAVDATAAAIALVLIIVDGWIRRRRTMAAVAGGPRSP